MQIHVQSPALKGAGDDLNLQVGRLATLLHAGSALSMALQFMDGDSIPRNLEEPALDPCLAAFDQLAAQEPGPKVFPNLWNRHVEWMKGWMGSLKSGQITEFSIPTDPDTIRPDVRNYLIALAQPSEPLAGERLIAAMQSLRWAISVLDSLGGALRNADQASIASQMDEAVTFFKQFYDALYQVYERQGKATITI